MSSSSRSRRTPAAARPAGSSTCRSADALIQRLRLAYVRGLFDVTDGAARRDGERLVSFARDGRFAFTWRTLQSQTRATEPEAARPPIDPIVNDAGASVVVTLDGQRIGRYRYHAMMHSCPRGLPSPGAS